MFTILISLLSFIVGALIALLLLVGTPLLDFCLEIKTRDLHEDGESNKLLTINGITYALEPFDQVDNVDDE